MSALVALLLLPLAHDAGFGGAPIAAPEDAPAIDDSPGQAELRTRLNTTLEHNAKGTEQLAEQPVRRTKLEEELERAHLDATIPLLAFRIEVARADLELEDLLAKGARPERVQLAEERVASLRGMSDLVERIALARLSSCTRALGQPIVVKTWRMTAGGPVALSAKEMVEQVPNGDPEGCERITLMDVDTIAKVRRLFSVRAELDGRSFGYHEVAERKRLEGERDALERALQQQAVAGVVVANPPR